MAVRPDSPRHIPLRTVVGILRRPGALALMATAAWLAQTGAQHACQVDELPQREVNAFAAEAAVEPAGDTDPELEPAVILASDRGRERQFDRARRLVADGRWSDAATICDELLADEQDAFLSPAAAGRTGGSIRSATAALVARLPRPGRDAYLLLFRGRAEKQLADAIAAADHDRILAVARRWFHTPAGRQAAVIAAVTALEAGQPLAALDWIDRLTASGEAGDLEPTLAVMRLLASRQSGDPAASLTDAAGRGWVVRLAGREISLSAEGPVGLPLEEKMSEGAARPAEADWRQPRGSPARNTVVDASRPLLVPRYRVPLVRHPLEADRLERRRRASADVGAPLLPAGSPLAVGDFLVVHTPLGILAIDFETGKRLWLESAVAPPEPEEGARLEAGDHSGLVFDDATSGNLSSDGRLVFAVETPPTALALGEPLVGGFGRGFGRLAAIDSPGNSLSAYSLAGGGRLHWRLPETAGVRGQEGGEDAAWFLGAPLVVGDELFLLVERGGEVRLEVRGADNGRLRWQQPLAAYDDRETITNAEARGRRLAGLTPALSDGVLVCPLGGGSVVAFDVAARSLLWSHMYTRPAADEEKPAGRELGEPCPVIAGDRVLLTPFDGPGLICLGLRDGRPAWPETRRGRVRLAGVEAARVIVVGDTAAEALDLTTGRLLWKRPLADLGRPSGRGVLTPTSLFLPLDTPEVVEIDLADGRIKARCPSRGGLIPGNLVPHRGELVSRGVDSLDVFHQQAALDARIEAAERTTPASPWAAYWRGQAAIEQGDVAVGLDLVHSAIGSAGFRVPPGGIDDTLMRAMARDFPAASRWEHAAEVMTAAPAVMRMFVDGSLAAGDTPAAWEACRRLLDWPVTPLVGRAESGAGEAERDPSDPLVRLAADRWVRGRLHRIRAAADPVLRTRIDAACQEATAAASVESDPVVRQQRIAALAERLGRHPAAAGLLDLLAADTPGLAGRQAAVRRNLLASTPAAETSPQPAADDLAASWPLGQVSRRGRAGESNRQQRQERSQLLPLALAGGGAAGTRAVQAAVDAGQRKLIVTDRFGREITEPLPLDGVGREILMPWVAATLEAAVAGRLLVVRTRSELVAYDLEAAPGRGRGLWRRPEYGGGGEPGDDARWFGVSGRVARDGGVPLGMRISEPDDMVRGDGRGLVAGPRGVVVPGRRSVTYLDPATGRLAWERTRLPAGLEWCVDEEFVCGLTVSGQGSLVLSADDGRLLHTFDVPHRRQRLATRGRSIVTVRSIDELPGRFTARRVRLELIDPAARAVRSLGEFSGEARATEAGVDRLAVMEPSGDFTILNLADGDVDFRTRLPEPLPPLGFARLSVQPWLDRYLVFAGAPHEGDVGAEVSPLQHLMLSSAGAAVMTGKLWAVARTDGQPLWPVPAVIEQHCLHTAQPPDLPVLTFCRLLAGRGDRQKASLSLLVLDKRTGHAVLEDDRIAIQPHDFFGCEVRGEPAAGTVTIAEPGGPIRAVLAFTGAPIPPQPPYRGRGRTAGLRIGSGGGLEALGRAARQILEQQGNAAAEPDPPDLRFFDPEDFE